MSKSESQDCHATALRLLSRREHSSKELQQKLQTRGFESGVIERVLSALRADRYLSDERFAESYVRSKRDKGLGPQRLRQELREHALDDELIERYLHDHEWRRLAVEVREKRFGRALPQSYEERARQMRFLQYRGFTSEQINGAMKQNDWE